MSPSLSARDTFAKQSSTRVDHSVSGRFVGLGFVTDNRAYELLFERYLPIWNLVT